MSVIAEYPLTNTGAEVQQAITDALTNLPAQLNQKAGKTQVLLKDNTTAYTPTLPYHPATKAYADSLRPEITIGTVTTGAAGSAATVVNSGTNTNAILDFSIPMGYYIGSVTRTSGTGAPGTTDVYTMKLNDTGQTSVGTFNVYNGTDASITLTMTNNDNSLTITGSPLTGSGTITLRHRNAVTASSVQGVRPIAIDSAGHISGYGNAFYFTIED